MSVKINWGNGEVDVAGQVSVDDMPKIHALMDNIVRQIAIGEHEEQALLVISDMFGMDMPDSDHYTQPEHV